VVDYSSQSWQDIATELGRITGHARQAAEAIARFDAYVAQAAASITPPAKPVSIVAYNLAGSYSIGRAASPHARLLAALGFKVEGLPPALAPQVTRSSDFEFISRENLSAAITGDSVFLLGASQGDVQAFLDDPLLANLPAVAGRRVYALGPTSFRIDYYSGQQMVDAVARHFR
jgi:iron complex transport system substrate-binding protein